MSCDYYEALEINRDAIDADIKMAYRRLALKFHPSRNQEAGSNDRFVQLGEAYDVLSDPRKKATYDKFGEEGLKGGIPAELASGGAWSSKYIYHANPDKTFRQFFGSDNPFADFYTTGSPLQYSFLQAGVEKTQDSPIERDLHLSLDDLFHGCIKKIKISRRGFKDLASPEDTHPVYQSTYKSSLSCWNPSFSTGFKHPVVKFLQVMNEEGHTSSIKDKILTIEVKPGWKEGTRIIFSKEGDQGPHCIPADIVFIVREKTHHLFTRQHNDLIYKVKISLEMALTGFNVHVQTLDGRLLTIPVNDIVHPSYKKVLSGEGMPLPQDPSQRGNLIIAFDIEFPEKLSAESKNLIKHALSLKY